MSIATTLTSSTNLRPGCPSKKSTGTGIWQPRSWLASSFAAPSKLDTDRRALKPEVVAQHVIEIAHVAEVDHLRIVHETGEARWTGARLGRVIDLELAASL